MNRSEPAECRMRGRVHLPNPLWTSDGCEEGGDGRLLELLSEKPPSLPSLLFPLCYRLLGSLWVACQGGMGWQG